MIYIGSEAIKYWYPSFPREPKDKDYLVENLDDPNILPIKESWELHGKKSEFLVIPPLWNFLQKEYNNYSPKYLYPNVLYTLKMSHMFWDFSWDKHMFDIQFLKSKGCVLIKPLFDELYEYWNEYHGKNKRSQLDVSAQKFFDNALKKYDHDYLHTLINPIPTYTKILKDGAEVDVDENKFNALSFEDKLELVREEIYVMAYERLANRDYRAAYFGMLKKFIMNHSPIFEAIFIIENFKILHKPIINYKQKLDYDLSRNC